jgi:pyrimidine operon attenuation protein/uracil phosphoribosyltransferase
MRLLLDENDSARGLRRMAGEIIERHRGIDDLVIVAVRRGGIAVARELIRWIHELERRTLPLGTVDITLYRDDAATALPNPRIGPSEIPGTVDDKIVVLVDDVVYTGRTIRAAIDAVMDYGRPRRVELAALVDRGGRELPIQPNYIVKTVEVATDERVDVVDESAGLRAIVQLASSPTLPPPKP